MVYVANVYQGDHVAATDLQNIENNFEYLRTNFNSASSPADPGGGLEGVIWWDSGNKNFKGRSDTEWRGIFSGAASFKIWAYLDTVPDGWTRETEVTDEVLAFKGGSTYTTGAQRNKGSWTISGIQNESSHTHSHNHKWHDHVVGNETRTYNSGGTAVTFPTKAETGLYRRLKITIGTVSMASGTMYDADDGWTDNDATAGSAHTHTQDGSWRIKAAVGIMLYPKL
ncbi:MAG: hypothetical protein ACXABY_34655 [Candidatus Thorarchaeota archaeon]|jgi:hypothetical protein